MVYKDERQDSVYIAMVMTLNSNNQQANALVVVTEGTWSAVTI